MKKFIKITNKNLIFLQKTEEISINSTKILKNYHKTEEKIKLSLLSA